MTKPLVLVVALCASAATGEEAVGGIVQPVHAPFDVCAEAARTIGMTTTNGECVGASPPDGAPPPPASSLRIALTPKTLEVTAGEDARFRVVATNTSSESLDVHVPFGTWPPSTHHRVFDGARQVGTTPWDECRQGLYGSVRSERPTSVVVRLQPGGAVSAIVSIPATVHVADRGEATVTTDDPLRPRDEDLWCPKPLRALGRMWGGTYRVQVQSPVATIPLQTLEADLVVQGRRKPAPPPKCASLPLLAGLPPECLVPLSPDVRPAARDGRRGVARP